MFRRLVFIVAALPLLVACHDDDAEDIQTPAVAVALSESEVAIGPLGRYYTVTISEATSGDSVVKATPMADWIEVDEILSSSLRIYVHPNTDESRRETTVLIMTAHGGTATLTVTQRSEADSDDNALPTGDSLILQGRVGFGYDLTQDYMDVKSATECVFDYNQLLLAERDYGTIIAQERRNRIDYTLHTAYSIAEMAENLMSEQTDGVKFLGLSRKLTKYKSVKTFQSDKQSYGFAKISKTVATRYIDMGKIDALIREGRTNIFTPDFLSCYEAVLQNPSDETVEKLVKKYGTHVVTYADLGGRLEYTINFKAEQVSRDEMERTMKYKNGNLKDSDTQRRKTQLNNINSSMDVTVYGGSEETRTALQKASPTTDTNQQIPTALLAAWTYTIVNNPDSFANLAMANCRLTPIWQLFPQEVHRNAVLSYIQRMSERLMLSADELLKTGLYGYRRFNVADLQTDKFGTDANSTLVKVGYVNNIPMLEICNEYVPEIRGDKRVTIIYPISSGHMANIRRGIFAGNRDNPPCEVSFDDEGGCYISQLEGYKAGDSLKTLYYIDGALYDNDMNVPMQDAKVDVRNQQLDYVEACKYNSPKGTLPLVKIGPFYWTRQSVIAGYYYPFMGGRLSISQLKNFKPNELNFYDYQVKPFGKEKDEWFFPTINDMKILLSYFGNNIKPIFPNQQSGFDLSFDGYEIVTITRIDDTGQRDLSKKFIAPTVPNRRNTGVGALLFGKERNLESFRKGKMLLVNPDYTFSVTESRNTYSQYEEITVQTMDQRMNVVREEKRKTTVDYEEIYLVPVRFFRNSYFKYDNL